jgi:hypothetical protein
MPDPQGPFKLVSISDVHLGEDCSLLSFPHGRWHLWEVIRKKLGSLDDGRTEIEELIMVGDIPDRCLSSTAQIITACNAFSEMLGSAAKIRKSVYVIGNHDHTLWTSYHEKSHGTKYGISEPGGDLLIGDQNYVPDESAKEILTVLFGYDKGSSWRGIKEAANPNPPAQPQHFDFVVANPVYAKQLSERTYVFSHGVHFDNILAWADKLNGFAEDLKEGLLGLFRSFRRSEDRELEDLEKRLAPIMDELWKSSGNNPTGVRDHLYYLLCQLTSRLGKKRSIPKDTAIFSWADLPNCPEKRVNRLTNNNKPRPKFSTKRFERDFLPKLVPFLDSKLQNKPKKITFVHGHTHDGGWGELTRTVEDLDRDIRIYDLGGWVVHGKKEHPPCHIFCVDKNGDEYLLDVSFKEVKVEQQDLLELAQQDAENRGILLR